MARFEVRRITDKELTPELGNWLVSQAYDINAMYGFKHSGWVAQEWMKYFSNPSHVFIFCFENGKPRGFIWGHLGSSMFDSSLIVLKQILLYSRPNSRATKYLLDSFVDFGRQNAKHIITTVGMQTNIKASSLKLKGFRLLEVDMILEV